MKKELDQYYFDHSEQLERRWEQVFDYFGQLRTDDDVYFLRSEYPKQYEWFVKNAYRFEYGMTDNQIFRYLKISDELKFKGIASISLSSSFTSSVKSDKLMSALVDLHKVSPIQQIKFIDCGNMDCLRPFFEWAKTENIETMFHYNFLDGERELLTYDWVDQQVTWIDVDTEGNMQVYGDEAVCIYFDRFYFSNDVASDPTVTPYLILNEDFDPEKFLTAMARGKQVLYNRWKDRTLNIKFKKYFTACQNYKFNDRYNFIPSLMMVPFGRYYENMLKRGWQPTKHGFYKNDGKPLTSFVERL